MRNGLFDRLQNWAKKGIQAGICLTMASMMPALAQDAGQVATSAAGRAGQRQTLVEGSAIGITPLSRIASRVPNRVQSRIRNRIDAFYDPQANATSPFVLAGNQVRTAGRQQQR